MRVILVFLVACLVASCGGGRHDQLPSRAAAGFPRFDDADPHDWAGPGPWQYPVHGVDVSRYQGDIDWGRVRSSGVAFAFLKATEGGDYVDDHFSANWQAARRAGLWRGAYHYFYFCRPASQQAAWFITHVPRDAAALPAVLDLEWNHRSRTCPFRPDAETVRSEARVFLDTLTRYYGKRPVIYSTMDFFQENELWKIQGYPFWLRSVAGHPSDTYPDQRWAFWQYTGTGLVAGIDGPTDLNVFAGTPSQLSAWAN